MEVPARIELAHKGFADLSLTTWARHRGETTSEKGKRETSLELATSTLGKLHSTTELLSQTSNLVFVRPPNVLILIIGGWVDPQNTNSTR